MACWIKREVKERKQKVKKGNKQGVWNEERREIFRRKIEDSGIQSEEVRIDVNEEVEIINRKVKKQWKNMKRRGGRGEKVIEDGGMSNV